ncbi:MAG: outer membrane beta-barrel domain-containing protein [Bradymonadaceae bacterium]|nr:outer membrane beta-barrel domain-containing protein [Lujinxingiaceae bacterium]
MMDVLRFRISTVIALLLAATVMTADATSAWAQNEGSIDGELSEFWAVDRKLPVVKDKLFTREGRFGVGLFTGMMSSEPFLYYIPVGGRLSYHFRDQYGIEISGQFTDVEGVFTHDTELTEFFKRRSPSFDSARHTEDRFLWRANAVFVWSPFYGKFAVLQRKLSHFDLNLAAGLGAVGVERPSVDRDSVSSTLAPELVLGGGIHFFMTQAITLRLEGRAYVYQGAKTPVNKDSFFSQINVPTEFQLGVNYLF